MVLSYQRSKTSLKKSVPKIFGKSSGRLNTRLNIEVSHGLGMGLDELAAWVHGVTHQHVEGAVRLGRVIHRDDEQGPVLRIHGCLPQLCRIHFTKTLISLETCLLANFLDDFILVLLCIGILDLILVCNPIQWRLCNIKMTIIDQLRHIAEEERQQQRAD